VGRVSACQVDARHHTGEGCLRSCLRSRALKEQEVAFEEVECRGVEGRFIGEGNNLNRPQVPAIPAPQSVPPVTHHGPLTCVGLGGIGTGRPLGTSSTVQGCSDSSAYRGEPPQMSAVAGSGHPERQGPSRTLRLGLGLLLASHFPFIGHHRMYFIPPSSSSMPENGRQACNSHPARGSDRHTQDSMDGRTRHRSHAGR
jgi:hypothetical protein